MPAEYIATCPDCKTENILPDPGDHDLKNGRVLIPVTFNCESCGERVSVPVAELEPVKAL